MADDPKTAVAIATRAALRVLPLVTLPGIWAPSAIAALHHVFRVSVLSWTDLAYPLSAETGWSEDRENALRRLWNAGFTASEIAKSLGGVSRNAVIGKAHRLGMQSGANHDNLTIANHDDVVAHFMSDTAQAAARACLSTFPVAIISASGPSVVSELRSQKITEYASRAAFLQGGEATKAQLEEAVARDRTDLTMGLTPYELMWLPLWNSADPIPGIQIPADGSNIWSFWQDWHDARRRGCTTDGLPFGAARGLDLAISAIDRGIWDANAGTISDEINRLRRKARSGVEKTAGHIPEPEPQSLAGLRFSGEADSPITIADLHAAADDTDAWDRHAGVLEAIEQLITGFQPGGAGGNQAAPIVRDVQALERALGDSPRTIRLGLAIPRGERLRQTLNMLESHRSDENAPLPSAEFMRDLRVVVSSYNVLVALDPNLEARDRAQLSPSLIDREAPPHIAAAALADAVANGVADPSVPTILSEEAAIAPAEPTSENRSSRRYTEGFRNFCRAAAAQVRAGVSLAWRHKGKIVFTAGTAKGAAMWIAAHEALLLRVFPPGSSMHELVLRVVNIVKMLS